MFIRYVITFQEFTERAKDKYNSHKKLIKYLDKKYFAQEGACKCMRDYYPSVLGKDQVRVLACVNMYFLYV